MTECGNSAVNADCFDDTCRHSTIEFNHVHNCGRQDETGLCDGGGLHMCCSNCTEAGRFRVNHNHVHHISTFQHGGCGLYVRVHKRPVFVWCLDFL